MSAALVSGSIITIVPLHNDALRFDFGRCDQQSPNFFKLILWQQQQNDNLSQKFRIIIHDENESSSSTVENSNVIVSFQSVALLQQNKRRLNLKMQTETRTENDDDEVQESSKTNFLVCVSSNSGSQCFVGGNQNKDKTTTKFRLIPVSDKKSVFFIQPVFEDETKQFSLFLEANQGRGLGAEIVVNGGVEKPGNEPNPHQMFRFDIFSAKNLRETEEVFEAFTIEEPQESQQNLFSPFEEGDVVEFIPRHNPSLRIT
jgi:hypothetical protein